MTKDSGMSKEKLEERKHEIEFVMGLITQFCIDSNITLHAVEHKGVLGVAIYDHVTKQDFYMLKNKEENTDGE